MNSYLSVQATPFRARTSSFEVKEGSEEGPHGPLVGHVLPFRATEAAVSLPDICFGVSAAPAILVQYTLRRSQVYFIVMVRVLYSY